jgi:hypothetical protein
MAFGQNKNGLASAPGALPALPQATVKKAFGQILLLHPVSMLTQQARQIPAKFLAPAISHGPA